ncbi:hypothetical protein [Coxiella endosymbiont of Ornithodoros amblus]|nr:hypothetical protein [Coxiella endosymbiont of Ornithodoros amblus]
MSAQFRWAALRLLYGVELAAETKNHRQAIPLAIIGSIVFFYYCIDY